jgi:hypothetical protein
MSTYARRAEDVAVAIENQAAVGFCAIAILFSRRNSGEAVQHLLRPLATFLFRPTQLEHCPARAAVENIAARSFASAKQRHSIQIARCVEHQSSTGKITILPALEVVQHAFRPRSTPLLWRAQLIYRAAPRRCPEQHTRTATAVTRRAVQVPRAVRNQAARRTRSIVLVMSLEHVQHRLGPSASLLLGWTQLVNRSAPSRRAVRRSTLDGYTIEIARLVEDQSSPRERAVRPTLEAVEHLLLPLGRGGDRQREGNGKQQINANPARRRLLVGHGATVS